MRIEVMVSESPDVACTCRYCWRKIEPKAKPIVKETDVPTPQAQVQKK